MIVLIIFLFLWIGVLYWALNFRVGQLLRERHPAVWETTTRQASFRSNASHDYALRRRDRDLGDGELTRNVVWLRWVWVVLMIGFALTFVSLILDLRS